MRSQPQRLSQLRWPSSLPRRLPRGNPLGASRIEIRRHAEVEGCTKNSVGERDRGELARLERRVGSMRLKFVHQVPQTVQ